jgi:predicted permease
MRHLILDLRFAIRNLVGQPAFALAAVASLALGIGANTAIFSLVDQLLLWKVPARDPASLVVLKEGRSMTYPFFREYRDRQQVFTDLIASSRPTISGLRPDNAPAVEPGRVCYVSGTFFSTLGAGAATGRVIQPEDEKTQAPVAVLSYAYWQQRFGASPNVIGSKINVNGIPVQIAGVAEKGFNGIFQGADQPLLFLPLTIFPITSPQSKPVWNTPNMHWLFPMARLKPGVSIDQAQAGMRVLWAQTVEAVNGEIKRQGGKARDYKREKPITLKPGGGGASTIESADPFIALLIATGLVLLIACANVANLLLARSSGRAREMAMRTALGASRSRLIAQLFTESFVLALAGSITGIVLAAWGLSVITRTALPESGVHFEANARMMLFAIGVTMLAALLFGLLPALRATGVNLAEFIKDGSNSSQSRSRLLLGRAVVAAQVALTVPLLVGSGLFLRTLVNLQKADIGFERENILIVDIDPTPLGYREHRLRTFYDQLLERARAIPGVRSASLSLMTPMGEFAMSRSFIAEGYQPKENEQMFAYSNSVSHGFFTTLGIPMLLGRDFNEQDEPAITPSDNLMNAIGRSSGGTSEAPASATRACIINESMARKYFGSENAIGRHISIDDKYDPARALEIVGIVKDVNNASARNADRFGTIYLPSWANGAEARWLSLRINGNESTVIDSLRSELRQLDSNVPLLRFRKMDEYVSATYQSERMIALLCAVFGAIALMLAAVGLYGVMTYAVAQRTREVGIRVALGASTRDVVAMVLRESLMPVLAGLVIGLGLAIAATRFATAMLFGVAPFDPLSIAIGCALLITVSIASAAIPARRAGRLDPVETLRHT